MKFFLLRGLVMRKNAKHILSLHWSLSKHDNYVVKVKTCFLFCIISSFLVCFPLPNAFAEQKTAQIKILQSKNGLSEIKVTPDENSATLGYYFNGTKAKIINSCSQSWEKVSIGTIVGYISNECITTISDPTPVTQLPTYTSTSTGWEVYDTPSLEGPYQMYGYGETVTLLGYSSKWWHIMIGDHLGFVKSSPNCLKQISGYYYAGHKTAIVNNPNPTDRLHLRSSESTQSVSLGKYYNGCTVVVLDNKSNSWDHVRIGTTEGYMQNSFLAYDKQIDDATFSMPTALVANPNGSGVNLRIRNSSSSKITDYYPNGTQVTIMGVCGKWYHVQINDRTGYMIAKYLQLE